MGKKIEIELLLSRFDLVVKGGKRRLSSYFENISEGDIL